MHNSPPRTAGLTRSPKAGQEGGGGDGRNACDETGREIWGQREILHVKFFTRGFGDIEAGLASAGRDRKRMTKRASTRREISSRVRAKAYGIEDDGIDGFAEEESQIPGDRPRNKVTDGGGGRKAGTRMRGSQRSDCPEENPQMRGAGKGER